MKRTRSHLIGLLALAIGAVSALGCASDPPPTVDAATQRRVAQGTLVGSLDDGAHVWRGVPFAAPPVGALRWRAPHPPEPWEGEREAIAFGEQCPQLDQGSEIFGAEDCLTLNVFAPADASGPLGEAEGGLPVMFFIHGGGNSIGSADVYDGARLARENRVVVVTVQYRLGVFGWFNHPALRAAAQEPLDASGNWGTLDMIRALEWVRANVAVFGGDASRVTIFGESAGGVNVFSLLISPRAKGLFHGAIVQSGFATSFDRAQSENAKDAPEPGLEASATEVLLMQLARDGAEDRAAAKAQLAAMSDAEIRSWLHAKSVADLLGPFAGSGALGGMYFAPFVLRDGAVIPEGDPLELLARGEYNRVPVVLGTNRDEHKLFLMFASPHLARLGPLPLWFKDERRYDLSSEYGANLWKASGVDEPAASMRAVQGPSVWAYRFDWDEQPRVLWVDLARALGAGHALELLFVFGGTDSDFAQRWLLDDAESAETLSRQMRSYWAQFAATGDPGRGQEGDLPAWTPWALEAGAPKYLILDSPRDQGLAMATEVQTRAAVIARVATDERLENDEERCEIYGGFVQWSDALTPDEYEQVAAGACQKYPLESRTPFEGQ